MSKRTIFDMGRLAPTTKFDVICGRKDWLGVITKAPPPEPMGRLVGDFRLVEVRGLTPNEVYLIGSKVGGNG